MSQFPIINPQDVTTLEMKYYDFIRRMATTTSQTSLDVQTGLQGVNGRKYNRYVFQQGQQSITVDFRVFTVSELPPNFRYASLRSPACRSMIATIKSLGCKDLIGATLTWLNDNIQNQFADDSGLYYAMQTKVNNLHCFYYAEKNTENKVVIQVQL